MLLDESMSVRDNQHIDSNEIFDRLINKMEEPKIWPKSLISGCLDLCCYMWYFSPYKWSFKCFFGPSIVADSNKNFKPSKWLLEATKDIANATVLSPTVPLFWLVSEEENIQYNTNHLVKYIFDLTRLINDHQPMLMAYKSNIHLIHCPTSIYCDHNLFPLFPKLHQNRMDHIYKEKLSDSERINELKANVVQRNHKSATLSPEELWKMDEQYGLVMPIQKSIWIKIPGAMVQPCKLSAPFALTKIGERVLKYGLIHDLTFSITQVDSSINKWCHMDVYPEMIYRFCLMPIIHIIVALSIWFPTKKILINKYNFSNVYQRISHMKNSTKDNPSIWNVGICLPTTLIWWISKNVVLVLLIENDDRSIEQTPSNTRLEFGCIAQPNSFNVGRTSLQRWIDAICNGTSNDSRSTNDSTLSRGHVYWWYYQFFMTFSNIIKKHTTLALLVMDMFMWLSAGEKELLPRKEILLLDKL